MVNTHWQILENSSRNCPEISVFRGGTQTDSWKTHPVSFRNFNFRVISWTDLWETRPYLDEFSRNRSVSRPGELKFRENFWMSFPGFVNKGFARHSLNIIFRRNALFWMSPEIGLCPKLIKLTIGWVFQKLV